MQALSRPSRRSLILYFRDSAAHAPSHIPPHGHHITSNTFFRAKKQESDREIDKEYLFKWLYSTWPLDLCYNDTSLTVAIKSPIRRLLSSNQVPKNSIPEPKEDVGLSQPSKSKFSVYSVAFNILTTVLEVSSTLDPNN